jgi:hypothetical protein
MTRSYLWCLALALAAIVRLARGRAQAQSLGGTVIDPGGAEARMPKMRVTTRGDDNAFHGDKYKISLQLRQST